MDNFLPLSREVRNHWIYKDAEYLQVWIEMLFRARYCKESKTDIYDGILYTIEYGQFIFGLKSWSDQLSISYQRLRTLLNKMLKTEMITLVKRESKFSIYKINNYEKFNSQSNVVSNSQQSIDNIESDSNTNIVNNVVTNSQLTVSQQSANSQLTTKEERKKDKKEKKANNKYTDDFEIVWKMFLNINRTGNKSKAYTNYKNTLLKFNKEDILKATKYYIEKIVPTKEEKYIKTGQYFFDIGYISDYIYKSNNTSTDTNKNSFVPKQEDNIF